MVNLTVDEHTYFYTNDDTTFQTEKAISSWISAVSLSQQHVIVAYNSLFIQE